LVGEEHDRHSGQQQQLDDAWFRQGDVRTHDVDTPRRRPTRTTDTPTVLVSVLATVLATVLVSV
jgi:hypothetical protein